MTARVVVVSARRLIAEAVAGALVAEGVADVGIAEPDARLAGRVAAAEPAVLLFDLDSVVDRADELSAALDDRVLARRVGAYDTFSPPTAHAAFCLGVTGLVALTATPREILRSLLPRQGLASVTPTGGLRADELERLGRLTARELQVLRLTAQGLTRTAIADDLGITSHTVDSHKRRVLSKLEVRSQARAVSLAAAAALLDASG